MLCPCPSFLSGFCSCFIALVIDLLCWSSGHFHRYLPCQFSSVTQSCPTHCGPMDLQHDRPPCPSPAPGVYTNSCPLSQCCHPTISSSVIPLLLPPSIFPLIWVFSSESVLHIRWPDYWSFSFSISPSNEFSGLISFEMDWFDRLAVQGTLESLLQHHNSKASIHQHSAFFLVQLSHPYMITGKTIALTRWTFVGMVVSLLFNMLSMLVITFLPRSKRLLISWLQSPSAVIFTCPVNSCNFGVPVRGDDLGVFLFHHSGPLIPAPYYFKSLAVSSKVLKIICLISISIWTISPMEQSCFLIDDLKGNI